MKLFIYKTLFLSLIVFIIFHSTIGYVIKKYENKIYNSLSKDNVIFIKEKIRSEIRDGISKDRIINQDDAILLNSFIKKLNKVLDNLNGDWYVRA